MTDVKVVCSNNHAEPWLEQDTVWENLMPWDISLHRTTHLIIERTEHRRLGFSPSLPTFNLLMPKLSRYSLHYILQTQPYISLISSFETLFPLSIFKFSHFKSSVHERVTFDKTDQGLCTRPVLVNPLCAAGANNTDRLMATVLVDVLPYVFVICDPQDKSSPPSNIDYHHWSEI